MTSALKEGTYYHRIRHDGREYSIVLSQIRLFDRKRLQRKIRILSEEEFNEVIKRLKDIL